MLPNSGIPLGQWSSSDGNRKLEKRGARLRHLITGGLIGLLLSSGAWAQEPPDDAADEAIALTRETTATYSLFGWNTVTLPDSPPQQEWSAEFHQDHLHRVETPRDRLIADCAARTGSHLSLLSSEISRGPQVARAACGIQANSEVLEARVTGEGNGSHGRTRTVLVRDPEYVRTYDIADNGAIVGATIDDLASNRLLRMDAVELTGTVPKGVFSEESLDSSAVPDRFKSAPPAGSLDEAKDARQ